MGPLTASWLDLILLAVAVEALLLITWSYRRGLLPELPELLANLSAGACLLFALRSTLADQPGAALLALSGALFAHLADLGLRYRRNVKQL